MDKYLTRTERIVVGLIKSGRIDKPEEQSFAEREALGIVKKQDAIGAFKASKTLFRSMLASL